MNTEKRKELRDACNTYTAPHFQNEQTITKKQARI